MAENRPNTFSTEELMARYRYRLWASGFPMKSLSLVQFEQLRKSDYRPRDIHLGSQQTLLEMDVVPPLTTQAPFTLMHIRIARSPHLS
jgi:hypothetical protein